MTQRTKVWAVLRDGDLHSVKFTQREAILKCAERQPGSQYTWSWVVASLTYALGEEPKNDD